jgi:GMP synthase-like glutamine amidotransferase
VFLKRPIKVRIHYFQHDKNEGLGTMASRFSQKGYELQRTPFFSESWALPLLEEVDFLVVLGGPMGVYEKERFPWLNDEIELVRACLRARKPVLGVCLGAQILASALGARVYPQGFREIGWFPVQFAPGAPEWLSRGKPDLEVFHWHGDTFDLPEGATRLASSQATLNQAFLWGDCALGLQFHLETGAHDVEIFVQQGQADLIKSDFCQSKDQILGQLGKTAEVKNHLDSVLEYLEQKVIS